MLATGFASWGACLPEKRRSPDLIKPEVRNVINGVVQTHHAQGLNGSGTPWPLVLTGPAGVGKSCAALCLLDYARINRKTFPGFSEPPGFPAYVTTSEWVAAVTLARMGKYEPPGCRCPIYEHELWAWWKSRPIVCLDELGTRGQVTDSMYDITKLALDQRESKPLIVVSNLDLDRLAEVYDDRIASRLAAGTVIHVTGEDRRLVDKQALPEVGDLSGRPLPYGSVDEG